MKHSTFDPYVPNFELSLTPHIKLRQKQRCISKQAIYMVLLWGRIYNQRNGRTAHYVGQKEVKEAHREGVNLSLWQGIAVVQSKDGCLITAIRCKSPKKIRKMAGEQP